MQPILLREEADILPIFAHLIFLLTSQTFNMLHLNSITCIWHIFWKHQVQAKCASILCSNIQSNEKLVWQKNALSTFCRYYPRFYYIYTTIQQFNNTHLLGFSVKYKSFLLFILIISKCKAWTNRNKTHCNMLHHFSLSEYSPIFWNLRRTPAVGKSDLRKCVHISIWILLGQKLNSKDLCKWEITSSTIINFNFSRKGNQTFGRAKYL